MTIITKEQLTGKQPYAEFTNDTDSVNQVPTAPPRPERKIFAQHQRRVTGVITILCGIMALVFSIAICAEIHRINCIFLVTVWATIMLVLSGLFSIRASQTGKKCSTVACLVFSIIAVILCILGLMSSTFEFKRHKMMMYGHHGHHGHHRHHHHHHHCNKTRPGDEDRMPMPEEEQGEPIPADGQKMPDWDSSSEERFDSSEERDGREGKRRGGKWDKDGKWDKKHGWGRRPIRLRLVTALIMAEMGVYFVAFIISVIQSSIGCAGACCKKEEQQPPTVYIQPIPENLHPKAVEAGFVA